MATRWTSQCFDSLPTAQYSRGSSLSLSDTLLRPIYVCVSPTFSLPVCVPLLPLLSILTLALFSLIHPTNSSFLALLPPSLSSLKKRQLERERESPCYAVCLPPHPDLPLCFRVPEKTEISNIHCHCFSQEIVSLSVV